MSILDTMFSLLLCPVCSKSTIRLSENFSKKKGLALLLVLECVICGYRYDSCTSESNGYESFDTNKRMVYTMRSCGQGYAGLQTFTTLMNMPKPMTANNCNKCIVKMTEVTKCVAEETMKDACAELHPSCVSNDEIIDTAVSCDGAWK